MSEMAKKYLEYRQERNEAIRSFDYSLDKAYEVFYALSSYYLDRIFSTQPEWQRQDLANEYAVIITINFMGMSQMVRTKRIWPTAEIITYYLGIETLCDCVEAGVLGWSGHFFMQN